MNAAPVQEAAVDIFGLKKKWHYLCCFKTNPKLPSAWPQQASTPVFVGWNSFSPRNSWTVMWMRKCRRNLQWESGEWYMGNSSIFGWTVPLTERQRTTLKAFLGSWSASDRGLVLRHKYCPLRPKRKHCAVNNSLHRDSPFRPNVFWGLFTQTNMWLKKLPFYPFLSCSLFVEAFFILNELT